MKTVNLAGIKTTLLGMGTGFNGHARCSNIIKKGIAEVVIRYAYEKGIRLFDCADTYGTHPYLREALKLYDRSSYVISTKIWPGSADADIMVDTFRKELGTDYIDIVQLHCMIDQDWPDKQRKQMDILETLKAKNIILKHGVSVHSIKAMWAADNLWVDIVHVRINPFGVEMDSPNPLNVLPVLTKLHESGKGIIGMKLIGNSKFSNFPDKIDETLKYVLNLGTVDAILIGFEAHGQIDDYIKRMDKL